MGNGEGEDGKEEKHTGFKTGKVKDNRIKVFDSRVRYIGNGRIKFSKEGATEVEKGKFLLGGGPA